MTQEEGQFLERYKNCCKRLNDSYIAPGILGDALPKPFLAWDVELVDRRRLRVPRSLGSPKLPRVQETADLAPLQGAERLLPVSGRAAACFSATLKIYAKL
jgi:hypothetical protein